MRHDPLKKIVKADMLIRQFKTQTPQAVVVMILYRGATVRRLLGKWTLLSADAVATGLIKYVQKCGDTYSLIPGYTLKI